MRKPNSPAQTNWDLFSSNEHTAPQAGATRNPSAEAALDMDTEDSVPLWAQNTLPASGWTLGVLLPLLEAKGTSLAPHTRSSFPLLLTERGPAAAAVVQDRRMRYMVPRG